MVRQANKDIYYDSINISPTDMESQRELEFIIIEEENDVINTTDKERL